MDLERRDDIESAIEHFLGGRLSVEGDQVMEKIRRREHLDVQGQNVFHTAKRRASPSDVPQKVRWVRSGICLVGVSDIGDLLTLNGILDAVRMMLTGDGTWNAGEKKRSAVVARLTLIGFRRDDQMNVEHFE